MNPLVIIKNKNVKFNYYFVMIQIYQNIQMRIQFQKNECTQYKLFVINNNLENINNFEHYCCFIFVNQVWYEYYDENLIQMFPYSNPGNIIWLF